MKISILCVGKVKEKFYREAIDEFTKRLGRYCKLEIIEVADEKTDEQASDTEIRLVKEKEGERILAKIKDHEFVYALAIQGENPTSEAFAKQINEANSEEELTIILVDSIKLLGGHLPWGDDRDFEDFMSDPTSVLVFK